ncbi:leucine-rich repeat receptor protein kinase HPCA1 isoform X2 [Vigna angularis]|nr:leucine-rich repeat receptor protein kinase HPCA1 isoform X2 [Vigna angularis]
MSEWDNIPPNWVGSNPCGGWDGIECTNSRITSISLASMALSGQLTSDIGLLSELVILDLSYNKNLTGPLPDNIGKLRKLRNLLLINCGFTGPIPATIGNLERLVFLSLNSNGFTGPIPAAIGNLSNVYWLDLAENQLEGSIPISNGTTPGLDMMYNTKHFHFGVNKLSGNIPAELFSSKMSLIHVLFESNRFTGSIPSTLGLVKSLEVVRFDNNFFSGSLPENINNLTSVRELFLSNNRLSGSLPNLTGMNSLRYLDMSNNSFDPSNFPLSLSTLPALTTIMMENTKLQGAIPVSLFNLQQLQTVVLKNNQLNGTLDIGKSISDQLDLLDLQINYIEEFKPQIDVSKVKIILLNNPICQETGVPQSYCSITTPNNSYSTPPENCVPVPCSLDQTLSPKCKCAYPYTGTLNLRAPSFSALENETVYITLQLSLMQSFQHNDIPVDSVSLSNPRKNTYQYLELTLKVFPSGQDRFNRTGISSVAFILSNQTYKPPSMFGPYYFTSDDYENFMNDTVLEGPVIPPSKSSNTAIIAGAAAGGAALLVLILVIFVYALHRKNKPVKATGKHNPFEQWGPDESSSSIPQLKGARCFSFEEIQNCTKNFSQVNNIGSGGYGKVYRGTLPNGQLIAVKRAQKESMQGGLEFKTEIELLSRVHHKNLVSLIGFCFEQGEQMLIYEYVANGTLKDTLLGKSGIRLDWIRRLKIALGAARGLDYLHELANPPIIHRDIKSTNILLDERLNAKVSDFGLSKPLGDGAKGYITTQVKGTMGYLDPEYYMTQQLTEKSDVYSFGVLMLEMITARRPIERGKYIVKVVKGALDKTKGFCGLEEVLDPTIELGTALNGFEKFVDLALQCVEESSSDRPSMNYVVKEIENMLQLAGSSPILSVSGSTSSSYNNPTKGSSLHPYDNEYFDSSVVLPRP